MTEKLPALTCKYCVRLYSKNMSNNCKKSKNHKHIFPIYIYPAEIQRLKKNEEIVIRYSNYVARVVVKD